MLKDTSTLDSEVHKEHQTAFLSTLSTDRADHSVHRPLCEEKHYSLAGKKKAKCD